MSMLIYVFVARRSRNGRIQDWPCLSVRMFQLENYWMDFYEIWYEHYDIEGDPKIALSNFLHEITK
jgi:hypothetical protein